MAVARKHVSAGFTLVEMVMVMTMVVVMTGIALPAIDLSKMRADSAVRELLTVMSASQNRAVLRQHDLVMVFDTATGKIRIHADGNNDGSIQATEWVRTVDIGEYMRFGRGLAPERPMGVAPVSFTQTFEQLPALTFHRDGSASQAGIIYLIPGRNATVTTADGVRAIEISRATGRSRCYTYLSGSWERC